MSQLTNKLKSSDIRDHNTTNNPPPTGGELETREQESPIIVDLKLEDVILSSNKGKENSVL